MFLQRRIRRLPTLQLSITSLFIPFMSRIFAFILLVPDPAGPSKPLPFRSPHFFFLRSCRYLFFPVEGCIIIVYLMIWVSSFILIHPIWKSLILFITGWRVLLAAFPSTAHYIQPLCDNCLWASAWARSSGWMPYVCSLVPFEAKERFIKSPWAWRKPVGARIALSAAAAVPSVCS